MQHALHIEKQHLRRRGGRCHHAQRHVAQAGEHLGKNPARVHLPDQLPVAVRVRPLQMHLAGEQHAQLRRQISGVQDRSRPARRMRAARRDS